jgi:hypothetical protein
MLPRQGEHDFVAKVMEGNSFRASSACGSTSEKRNKSIEGPNVLGGIHNKAETKTMKFKLGNQKSREPILWIIQFSMQGPESR